MTREIVNLMRLVPLIALLCSCGLSEAAQKIPELGTSDQFSLIFKDRTGKPPHSATLFAEGRADRIIVVKAGNGRTIELDGSFSVRVELGDWYTDTMTIEIINLGQARGSIAVDVRFNS